MRRVIDHLRKKWGISSISRLWKILTIFALTGTTTLLIKEPLFYLLHVGEHTAVWIKVTVYVLAFLPGYFAVLLFFAVVFGEQAFFIDFIKKLTGRLKIKRSPAKSKFGI